MQIKPLHAIPSRAISTSGTDAPLTAADRPPMVETWSDLSPTRRCDLASALQAVTRMAGMPASNVLLTPRVLVGAC